MDDRVLRGLAGRLALEYVPLDSGHPVPGQLLSVDRQLRCVLSPPGVGGAASSGRSASELGEATLGAGEPVAGPLYRASGRGAAGRARARPVQAGSEFPGGYDEVAVRADAHACGGVQRMGCGCCLGGCRAQKQSEAASGEDRQPRKSRLSARFSCEHSVISFGGWAVSGGRPLALRTRLATGVPLSGYVSRMCSWVAIPYFSRAYGRALDLQAFFRDMIPAW
jgi:hypothetical protein